MSPTGERIAAVAAILGEHVTTSDRSLVVQDVDLHDLGGLLAAALDAPGLLDGLPLPVAVRLVRLAVRREDDGDDELVVELEVGLRGVEWSPSPGLVLRLDGLRIHHRGSTVAVVDGSGTFDGLDLSVTVELPSLMISAELVAPDAAAAQVDGGAFLRGRRFLPPDAGPRIGRSPRLLELTVDAAPRGGGAVIHAVVADLLDAEPFHLDEVEVELVHAAGLGGVAAGRVRGAARIDTSAGAISVELTADADPGGWHVTGAARIPPGATLRALVGALGSGPVGMPDEVADCALTALDVAFSSAHGDLSLDAVLVWPHDGAELTVRLTRSAGAVTATGRLTVGDLAFTVAFGHTDAGATMVGAVRVAGGHPLDLPGVLAALGADRASVPPLHVDLRGALVGVRPAGRTLLAADIDAGLDLGVLRSVPVLGTLLPSDLSIRLGLRPTGSTGPHPWPAPDVAAVRALAPPDAVALPDTVAHPVQIVAEVHLGGGAAPVQVPLDAGTATAPAPAATGAPAAVSTAPPATDVTWIEVGRRLGPIHLDRIGLAADGATQHVDLLISAALELGGLSLSVDGLTVGYTLPTGAMSVGLRGFGIDYTEGPVTIGGAFRNLDGEFAGSVVVSTSAFALHAVGSVFMVHGTPSVFLYGVLDYPLGGPPFFFVDGLAAGFAVHRSLTLPPVSQVRSFPLVVDAVAASTTAPKKAGAGKVGTSAGDDASAQLARLHDTVTPHLGEHFLAFGVKFTSFKLVECFALVVVRFGTRFEIDLLGTATYSHPPAVPQGIPLLAHVEMDLLGRFAPDEGVVSIEARLTERSFVYSELCHLSGGFAFCTWFAGEHAGDFVLSVGGYHPDFHRAHYPAVDRVGMRFQVTPEVYLKGSAYLALTPSVVMAGGELDGAAAVGRARAWFSIEAHFLIGWQPYHYDLRATVHVGAQWGPFHVSAGAELHVWGPDFSGTATVEWQVFSFTVHFGAGAPLALPITWAEFRAAFLPAADRVCSAHVAAGLVRSGDGGRQVVAPAVFVLEISTVVPATTATCNDAPLAVPRGPGGATRAPAAVGLGPTALGAVTSSVLRIVVERRRVDGTFGRVGAEFLVEPVLKSFPPAAWSTDARPDKNAALVTAIGGLTVRPAQPVRRSTPVEFSRSDVDYDVQTVALGAGRRPATGPRAAAADVDGARRARVLAALGAAAAPVPARST